MELPNRLTGLVNLRYSSARVLGVVDNVLFRGSQTSTMYGLGVCREPEEIKHFF